MIARPRIRQLDLGELLDETFRLYRNNFLEFIAIAALILVPYSIVSFAVQLPFQQQIAQLQTQQAGSLNSQSPIDAMSGLLFGMIGSLVIGLLYLVVFQPLMEGALARAISQRYFDQETGVGDAFGTALRRSPALIGARLIPALFGVLAYGVVLAVIGAGLFIILGDTLNDEANASPIAGLVIILIGLGLILLFMFVGVFFLIRFLFSSQAVIIENKGPIESLARSWRLTQYFFWRTLGYLLVIWLLTVFLPGMISAIFTTPASIFLDDQPLVLVLVSTVVGAVIQVIITPFSMIAYTLMYYDLRVRKEGFDLEQQTDAMMARGQLGPHYQVH